MIITPLYVLISDAILAITSDNVVEVLDWKCMISLTLNARHDVTFHVEQNIVGTGIFRPK